MEEIIKKHIEEYEKFLREIRNKAEKNSEKNTENWIYKNGEGGIYAVKVWRNDSETSRNIDYISVLEEKYFDNINSAVEYSKRYIKERFINPDGFRMIGESLVCSDICSWGKTIELKRIEVEKWKKQDKQYSVKQRKNMRN